MNKINSAELRITINTLASQNTVGKDYILPALENEYMRSIPSDMLLAKVVAFFNVPDEDIYKKYPSKDCILVRKWMCYLLVLRNELHKNISEVLGISLARVSLYANEIRVRINSKIKPDIRIFQELKTFIIYDRGRN